MAKVKNSKFSELDSIFNWRLVEANLAKNMFGTWIIGASKFILN
jgi:hypothetical protein